MSENAARLLGSVAGLEGCRAPLGARGRGMRVRLTGMVLLAGVVLLAGCAPATAASPCAGVAALLAEAMAQVPEARGAVGA